MADKFWGAVLSVVIGQAIILLAKLAWKRRLTNSDFDMFVYWTAGASVMAYQLLK